MTQQKLVSRLVRMTKRPFAQKNPSPQLKSLRHFRNVAILALVSSQMRLLRLQGVTKTDLDQNDSDKRDPHQTYT